MFHTHGESVKSQTGLRRSVSEAQHLLELAVLVHLLHNVGPAHKLPIHIQLQYTTHLSLVVGIYISSQCSIMQLHTSNPVRPDNTCCKGAVPQRVGGKRHLRHSSVKSNCTTTSMWQWQVAGWQIEEIEIWTDLRDGGPLGVVLDGFTQAGVELLVQYIEHLVIGAYGVQRGQHAVRKAALRRHSRALHKGNHLQSQLRLALAAI